MKVPSNVPSRPVVWKATFNDKTRLITARLWIDAVQEAALKFQCGPDEVSVVRLDAETP